jgi:pikromycin synthase
LAHGPGRRDSRLLFAFTGFSEAYIRMGRELYAEETVFRTSVDASLELAERQGESWTWSWERPSRVAPTSQIVRRDEMLRTAILQIALHDLWRSADVRPDGVLAIGGGEIAGAYAADALSRDDAIRVARATADILTKRPDPSVVFAISAEPGAVGRIRAESHGAVAFHGTLTPTIVLLLADADDAVPARELIQRHAPVLRECESQWFSHTSRIATDAVLAYRERLAHIAPQPPSCPMYTSTKGGALPVGTVLDADYWHWVSFHPCYFYEAFEQALLDGFHVSIEVGAHPEQRAAMDEIAAYHGTKISRIHPMRSDEPELLAWRRARRAARSQGVIGRGPSRRRSSGVARWNTPQFEQGPFASLAALREGAPVHWLQDEGAWLVVAFDEARTVLTDGDYEPPGDAPDRVLVGATGARHDRARHALAALLPRGIDDRYRERVGAHAEKTLAPLLAKREVDVVEEYAEPFAASIAGDILRLDETSACALSMALGSGDTTSWVETFGRVSAAVTQIAHRSGAYSVLDDQGDFDHAERCSLLTVLWIASMTTVRRTIASAILLLLRDPDLRGIVAARPDAIAPLVDETVRLEPPEMMLDRVATQPTRLGGTVIPAGAAVKVSLAAANRDPAVFDDPDEVRLDRTTRHLAFGGGGHTCLGVALARTEVAVAVKTLLRMAPDFASLQPLSTVRYLPSSGARAIERLGIAPNSS